jgi:hypothetical protein
MDFSFVPTTLIAPEQTSLIIWKVTAIAKPTPEHVILAWNAKQIDVGRCGCNRTLYFLFKAGPQCFVAVDLKHPFMFALGNGPILLPGRIYIIMLNDPSAILLAHLQSLVRTIRVDDEYLIRPLN